ncbi:C2 domain-containing protein [Crucibulum laeve]|uniref:C2 domain-containing protein n=1 Tax=Crucibulum laeve TaxID=68775 RepID=A0A5C3M7I6_9AGAR|nr:C2 domain-containing protein [Crucibulum laeve]
MATNGAASNGHAEADAIMKQDADKGRVAVHSFDSNASPSEKGAAAGKSRDQLKNVKDKPPTEREVHVETGPSSVIPTITIEDHDGGKPKMVASGTEQSVQDVQDEAAAVPGALPTGVAPTIPDWYRVGWRQMSGIDDAPLAEGEEKDKGILDMFLSEQFYGAWYHNAALIIFAVFASHFLTRFHFGWGWLFIILAVCNTYYSTSMERVRRRARDDIQRELVKTRLASEHETADWINHFLDRFWLIYEPVLSATVVSSVDQILSTNTPPFLDSLRLSQFTLGTKAPRIDKVRTFPRTDDDVVMMDWGISFTPNDISDMTPRQAASKVNPKIVLQIRVGKGLATASMPVLLEDITFSGLMRVRMKLMSNFPHVQVVDICFLEKPVIDYVLKPIGGETFGFDIANIPGLSSFIRDMTHATLGPMMYDPNVFTLNLEQMLSGKPLDAAIGVIQVTIHSARGIKGTKIGGGTPDPYVSLSINNRAELARTKYKTNTYNPTWVETKFLLVNALNESLNLNLYDYNDHRKNTLLGSATFELSRLLEDSSQEGINTPLLKDGKERGELRYDVTYYPVLEPEEGKEEVLDTTVGIVRLTVHQAKDLDHTKSLSGDLNPLAKIFLGDNSKAVFSTPLFKHTNNPVWESPYEYLCVDKINSVITLKVIDDRDFLKDPVVGYMSIKLMDLLDSMGEAGRDWFPLSGCKSGKVRLSAEWKPLSMSGSLNGSEQYTPPIGVVRLLVDKATDVKNVEATLGGKSDPYVRVQVRNVTKGRTEVVNNNLNPVWDQIIYIPVHSLKETLMLECMDYQHLTKDRSLGSVELHLADLAQESDDPRYPYKSTGRKTAADPLRLDKANAYKGHMHYTAEFIPALALKGVKFDSQPSQAQKMVGAAGNQDEEGGVVSDDGSSMSSSDEEAQAIPHGVTIKSHKKARSKSTDTTRTVESTHTAATSDSKGTSEKARTAATSSSKEEEGVDMGIDELLSQQSGIIVFNILSGNLPKKSRLEVLLDDGYWPCFSTTRSRSTHAQWDYVGEGFIKEIDFGQVWLRLNEADEGEKDDIIAHFKGDAKAFLQAALMGPQQFTLRDDDDKPTSTVTIEARYIPVPVKLEPRESINNQGTLRAELLDGQEIRGVDRGGKSDPFAVFTLNGQKVFKSQTKKKTLTPEWNESFEVAIPSRVGADFTLEIFDWNQIEQAKSLGTGKIDLTELEPFEAAERVIPLVSSKHGEKGQIRLRLVFQPEIIVKSRKNTSTFSSAGRAMTQIGGLPVTAGKGVFHGVTGVFKRGDRDEPMPTSNVASGQASQPLGISDHMDLGAAAFPSSDTDNGAQQPGTLRVTVANAKDLSLHDCKPYATLRLGDKEFKTKHTGKTASPEWNESFIFAASTLTPRLFIWIHDHKTLGKDKVLGEGEVDIWRHIQAKGVSSAEVRVELQQGGLLTLRLEFDPSTNPASSSSSISSGEHVSRTMSIASPSRFSLRGRRPGADHDEQ